ncbi:MAG: glycosyltransferase [Chloroflexota bacterium]
MLTISDHSRQDAIRLLGLDPKSIATVGAGVSSYFRPARYTEDPIAAVRSATPAITRDYLLTVSGADPRKNTEALISAYSLLPRDLRQRYQLVISCQLPPSAEAEWRAHVAKVGLDQDDVVLTGFVSDSVLRSLYQAARLFVFPSLYEGFGLPVAEAIACHCPSLIANTSSLPEVLDWSPATFDPRDEYAIASGMNRALTDAGFYEQLLIVAKERALTHTWQAVAERTEAALQLLAPPSPATQRPSRTRPYRVALVGPMPPVRSGLAKENINLVPHLSKWCELDIYATGSHDTGSLQRDYQVRVFPAQALGRITNPYSYDAIFYSVGNSHHHHDTYELAKKYPGIVWLHDVRLGGMYITYGLSRHPGGISGLLSSRLPDWYGDRLAPALATSPSQASFRRYGMGLTPEWVRGARGVIVNSAFAERLLRLDQGPNGPLPRLWRLFLPVPARPTRPSVQAVAPPTIVSVGLLDPIKAPEAIIDALGPIAAESDARLVFVGPVDPDFAGALLERAAKLGFGSRVEITGEVDESEYWGWLNQATCAVQLRLATNGESSGTIRDCIAAGLPVVTNMIGAAEEFPADVVRLIAPQIGTDELREEVLAYVQSEAARQVSQAAGERYARDHSYARLSEEFRKIVHELS